MGSLISGDLTSYYQRTIYYDRIKVCADLEHAGFLSIPPKNYGSDNNYNNTMKKWEFGLSVDGRGSYFSPRPIEYCKEGVFPIIYVGSDIRAMNYYEDIGFEHCVNCYFYDGDVKSLFAFMTGVTRLESTRNIMNVLELFKERFTLKANINKIREFLDIDQIR